jgi:hypothetical protein
VSTITLFIIHFIVAITFIKPNFIAKDALSHDALVDSNNTFAIVSFFPLNPKSYS